MRRVVVTGLGIVCSLGRGAEEVWRGVEAARAAFGPLTLFDPGNAPRAPVGEVDSPGGDVPRGRQASRLERMLEEAACEALDQAGLAAGPATSSMGVALGTSNGGMLEAEEWYSGEIRTGALGGSAVPGRAGRSTPSGFAAAAADDDSGTAPHGPSSVSPDRTPSADRATGATAPAPLSASPVLGLPATCGADRLAARLAARGPRLTVTTACSSSAAAIALAADRIRDGEAAAMIAGGGDPLCRLTYAGFAALRLLDPEGCRPFDERRRGLTLGEGAAILVLEEEERARKRGARTLAEVLDYGASCDAWHMTGCHPEGRGMKAAMREALDRSGLTPGRIGYVNAHGTATPANDAAEGRALAEVLGAEVPVSSTKSLHGHLLGGSGAVEAAITILALQRGALPATAGTERVDGAMGIDLITGTPRRARGTDAGPAGAASAPSVAVSNSFGFGGGNVVLVFAAPARGTAARR